MTGFPEPLAKLIEELGRLPGVGTRTAERLAFYLLKAPADEALGLAAAIREVKDTLVSCRRCFNFSQTELCRVCGDPSRDHGLVMVVEHPKDLVAFERTGRYRGTYHVLLGQVSPHDGTALKHLSVDRLRERLRGSRVREVILATNPTAEGDGTALALGEMLGDTEVRVTRLARGLPSGFTIEYAGTEVLADALEGRRRWSVEPEGTSR